MPNTKHKESAKPSRNVRSGKPELRHHQQSFLPQTSLVLSATGSLELRLVSPAILEQTNNTSRICLNWPLSVMTGELMYIVDMLNEIYTFIYADRHTTYAYQTMRASVGKCVICKMLHLIIDTCI